LDNEPSAVAAEDGGKTNFNRRVSYKVLPVIELENNTTSYLYPPLKYSYTDKQLQSNTLFIPVQEVKNIHFEI